MVINMLRSHTYREKNYIYEGRYLERRKFEIQFHGGQF